MPNTATVIVIVNTKDVVKQMIQGIAAYQYEIDCFQSITYKYFLNTSRTNNHYSNIGKPTKKLSNVHFFQATYHEYNAVTSTKRV